MNLPFTIVSKRYLEKLEQDNDFWREKFTSEQRRADRVLDSIRTDGGNSAVSDWGVQAEEHQQKQVDSILAKQARELSEIYNEQVSALDDHSINEELISQLNQEAEDQPVK